MRVIKTVLYPILFFFCIMLFAGCAKDDKMSEQIELSQLPGDASVFLKTFFPDQYPQKIEKTKTTDAENEYQYNVLFADNVTIIFDSTGSWQSIISADKELPNQIISRLVLDDIKEYVQNHFGNTPITGIAKSCYGLAITLQNNNKLAFQTYQSQFIGYELNVDEYNSLPNQISNSLSSHFPQVAYHCVIKSMPENSNEVNYMIRLKNKVKIIFDSENNWTEIYSPDLLIPESVIQSLPEKVKEKLKDYPNAEITEIIRIGTQYTIRVSDTLSIVIDPEQKPVVTDTQIIMDLVKKYFGDASHIKISIPYDITIYSITLPNGFDLKLNEFYNLLEVNGHGNPLPETFKASFPPEINQYIKALSDAQITKVKYIDNGYLIVLTNGKELKFANNGTFISEAEVIVSPYEKAYYYMRYNYPKEINIAGVTMLYEEWIFTLTDGTKIRFDKTGNPIL